ncbi:hypothetical protein [Streptomyces yaizuensis]|uniref:Helix-turn-helix transcriptional regulator n=1 Tax=Streptomyces yaizuensis TaxID=2989713 RepID=A0ABQ5P678_9ACTN|nr:hypothetical protein [Streptomyces sp. YSPA8]GLF98082.1 helix-turn-helix transcriptional regulator [Streptomyces sp. YSPA8]
MNEGYDRLAAAIRRAETLIPKTGLDRSAVFDISDLAFHSGLEESTVRRLLAGKRVPPITDFNAEVVRRIRFAHATRLKTETTEHGQQVRRLYTLPEIAAAAGMTPQWLHKLLKAPKAPNLEHSKALAVLFEVRIEFFTDPPALALALVLEERVLPDLESYQVDPVETLSRQFGLTAIAARGIDSTDGPDASRALLGLIHRLSQERRPK